jgi:hypothetical protein
MHITASRVEGHVRSDQGRNIGSRGTRIELARQKWRQSQDPGSVKQKKKDGN